MRIRTKRNVDAHKMNADPQTKQNKLPRICNWVDVYNATLFFSLTLCHHMDVSVIGINYFTVLLFTVIDVLLSMWWAFMVAEAKLKF